MGSGASLYWCGVLYLYTEVTMRNRAKCKNCGDVIESIDRHDFVTCSCFADWDTNGGHGICVDGGQDYMRRVGNPDDFIELPDDVECTCGMDECYEPCPIHDGGPSDKMLDYSVTDVLANITANLYGYKQNIEVHGLRMSELIEIIEFLVNETSKLKSVALEGPKPGDVEN